MIKLIATDLDGTFLRSDKTFDKDIFAVIEKLEKNGVYFAASSARQPLSVERIFLPVKEKIIIICENGANVRFKDKSFTEKMERETVEHICREAQKNGFDFFISGVNKSYTNNPVLCKAMITRFGFLCDTAETVQAIDDDFLKVSITDPKVKIRRDFSPFDIMFENKCSVTLSGINCLDFVKKGVSKGCALEKIRKELGISFDETAAFGDDFNDETMLLQARYSYAMGNADEKLKKKAAFVIGNNDSDAVIKEIKRLCDI